MTKGLKGLRCLMGLKLFYARRLLECLDSAYVVHLKIVNKHADYLGNPKWYKDTRKEHMQLARKYRDKLHSEFNPKQKDV